MIFELIQESEYHRPILKFKDSDAAWEAHSMICGAYSYPLQPSIVSYGGFENALEMFSDNFPFPQSDLFNLTSKGISA